MSNVEQKLPPMSYQPLFGKAVVPMARTEQEVAAMKADIASSVDDYIERAQRMDDSQLHNVSEKWLERGQRQTQPIDQRSHPREELAYVACYFEGLKVNQGKEYSADDILKTVNYGIDVDFRDLGLQHENVRPAIQPLDEQDVADLGSERLMRKGQTVDAEGLLQDNTDAMARAQQSIDRSLQKLDQSDLSEEIEYDHDDEEHSFLDD